VVVRGSRPWRAAAFAVVNLELTGLDPERDEIVSWCVVPVEGGAVQVAAIRGGRVRPSHSSGPPAVRVHGLRDSDLHDAPAGDAALMPLLEALEDRVLVAHVAAVERAFLEAVVKRLAGRRLRHAIDTDHLARRALPVTRSEPSPIELGRLARLLALPVHAPHTAAGDALTTAQVFLALATMLEDDGHATVASLVAASGRRRWHEFIHSPARRRAALHGGGRA